MANGRSLVPGAIAIDTNLFSVLLRYYRLESEDASESDRERQLHEVWNREDPPGLEEFEARWHLFEGAHRRIVTQHVVAEAFTNKMRKRSNWSSAIGLLPDYCIEERGCCVAELYAHGKYRRIVEDIGPTDAGLIYIAEVEKATIISQDGQLRHWATVRSVPVLTLNELDRLSVE